MSRFVMWINFLCAEILLPSEQLYQVSGFADCSRPEHINTLLARQDLTQRHTSIFGGTNNWKKANWSLINGFKFR